MSGISYQKVQEGLFISHLTYNAPPQDFFDMHTHNRYELLYILSGDVTHVIEDRKYKLKKDDLVIIKPNDYHYIRIDSPVDYERYDLLFDPELLGVKNVGLLPQDTEVINCRHRPIITDMYKKIDYYINLVGDEEFKDIMSILIKELFYNLSFASVTENRPENINPIVSKALAEINSGLYTVKGIDEIAKKLYVTESYLYRIFKRELKTTPLKYITEKRLHTAQSLINQGKKPTHIYTECGFNDYTSFYRSFVKLFGYPPSGKKN